jgi:hypothetical protein
MIRRASDGHLDGVAPSCRREDSVFAMLKFGKREKRTLTH